MIIHSSVGNFLYCLKQYAVYSFISFLHCAMDVNGLCFCSFWLLLLKRAGHTGFPCCFHWYHDAWSKQMNGPCWNSWLPTGSLDITLVGEDCWEKVKVHFPCGLFWDGVENLGSLVGAFYDFSVVEISIFIRCGHNGAGLMFSLWCLFGVGLLLSKSSLSCNRKESDVNKFHHTLNFFFCSH